MYNKSIILSLLIFLLFSLGFLAYTETQQQSATNQNWWIVYFENPKNGNLSFIIENNSNKTSFHYETSDGENSLEEADVEIVKGAKKEIFLNENIASEKIIIRVSAGSEKREIYKNFDK